MGHLKESSARHHCQQEVTCSCPEPTRRVKEADLDTTELDRVYFWGLHNKALKEQPFCCGLLLPAHTSVWVYMWPKEKLRKTLPTCGVLWFFLNRSLPPKSGYQNLISWLHNPVVGHSSWKTLFWCIIYYGIIGGSFQMNIISHLTVLFLSLMINHLLIVESYWCGVV